MAMASANDGGLSTSTVVANSRHVLVGNESRLNVNPVNLTFNIHSGEASKEKETSDTEEKDKIYNDFVEYVQRKGSEKKQLHEVYSFTEGNFNNDFDMFVYNLRSVSGTKFEGIQHDICNTFLPNMLQPAINGAGGWETSRQILQILIVYQKSTLIRIKALEGLRDFSFRDILTDESARGIAELTEELQSKLGSNINNIEEKILTLEAFGATLCAVIRHWFTGKINKPQINILRLQKSLQEDLHKKSPPQLHAANIVVLKIITTYSKLESSQLSFLELFNKCICLTSSNDEIAKGTKSYREFEKLVQKLVQHDSSLIDLMLFNIQMTDEVPKYSKILHYAVHVFDIIMKKPRNLRREDSWCLVYYLFLPFVWVAGDIRRKQGTREDAVCCLRQFWDKKEIRDIPGYHLALDLMAQKCYLLIFSDVSQFFTQKLLYKDGFFQEHIYREKILPKCIETDFQSIGLKIDRNGKVSVDNRYYSFRGHVIKENKTKSVFVKASKLSEPAETKVKSESSQKQCGFNQLDEEMGILLQLKHENIEEILHHKLTDPISYITHWTDQGRLSEFLPLLRQCNFGLDTAGRETLKYAMVIDVAKALGFLEEKRVIHRQVLPQNILVYTENNGRSYSLRLSNFSLAVHGKRPGANHFKANPEQSIPLKYTAIESILKLNYSYQSDRFSFGVLMWVVCTLGGIPYFELEPLNTSELLDKIIVKNVRMKQRSLVPDVIYRQILQCTHCKPSERPHPDDVVSTVEELLQQREKTEKVPAILNSRYSLPPVLEKDEHFEVVTTNKRKELQLKLHVTNVPDDTSKTVTKALSVTEDSYHPPDRPVQRYDNRKGKVIIEEFDARRSDHIKEVVENEQPLKKSKNLVEVICVKGNKRKIISRCPSEGDLKTYLLNNRSDASQIHTFFSQLVDAMLQLKEYHILHNDLRLSHVYLDKECDGTLVVKLGRYGRSCKILQGEYDANIEEAEFESTLPFPQDSTCWASPESQLDNRFTYSGHVYSLGIVLWEMYTCLAAPAHSDPMSCLPLVNVQDVQQHILPKPDGCPDEMYQLMIAMWSPHCIDRPKLNNIQAHLAGEYVPEIQCLFKSSRVSAFYVTEADLNTCNGQGLWTDETDSEGSRNSIVKQDQDHIYETAAAINGKHEEHIYTNLDLKKADDEVIYENVNPLKTAAKIYNNNATSQSHNIRL